MNSFILSKNAPLILTFALLFVRPATAQDDTDFGQGDSETSVPQSYGQQRVNMENFTLSQNSGVQSFSTNINVPGIGILPANRHFYLPNPNVTTQFEVKDNSASISIFSNGQLFRADRYSDKSSLQDGSAHSQWLKTLAEIDEDYSTLSRLCPVVVEIVEVDKYYVQALKAFKRADEIPNLAHYPIGVKREFRVITKRAYFASMMSSDLQFKSILSVFKSQLELRAAFLKLSPTEQAKDLQRAVTFNSQQGLSKSTLSAKNNELVKDYNPEVVQAEIKAIASQWARILKGAQDTLNILKQDPKALNDPHPAAAWEHKKVIENMQALQKIIDDSNEELQTL